MATKKQKQKKLYLRKTAFKKAGFTLIELLIVLSITIIMTAIAITTVLNSNKSASEVESAAEQLVSKLKNLQNNAVNGDINNGGAISICSFGFFTGKAYTQTGKNDRVYASAEYPCQGGDPTIKTSFLTAKGQAGSVTASDATAQFNVPLGDVNGATSITLTAGAEHYFVCIAVGGQIGGATGQANIYASKNGCP